MFAGLLRFGDTVVGRGIGSTKKVCKYETYSMALDRLKTKSIEELVVSLPDTKLPAEVRN